MPQPAFANGPWGDAIRYWLRVRDMSPADLVRATEIKEKKLPSIRANTISRARRGFHTTTRVLERIAIALNVPLEQILVSPDRRAAAEELKRLIVEAVETVVARPSVTVAPQPSTADGHQLVERLTKLSEDASRVGRTRTPIQKGGRPKLRIPKKR